MVFAPFKTIGRQSLGKTFTHGYAQSLVAAAQGSPTVHNHSFNKASPANKAGRPGSARFHSAFHNSSTAAAPSGKAARLSQDGEAYQSVGLNAYYDAWQRQQRPGAEVPEWKQFQFQKTITWKPQGQSVETRHKEREESPRISEHASIRIGLGRAHSAGTVDDIRKATAKSGTEARLDQAIASSIIQTKGSDLSELATDSPQREPFPLDAATLESFVTAAEERFESPPTSISHSDSFGLHSTIASEVSVDTSAQDANLQATYQTDLEAVITSNAPAQEKVQDALQVWLGTLGGGVQPNASFYSSLLDLLCQRTLNVWQLQKVLDIRRQRYGGFQEEGKFLLPSNEVEYTMIVEDDAISNALRIFDTWAAAERKEPLSSRTYQLLIASCARRGLLKDMVRIKSHQEQHNVLPHASIFPLMIEAFGTQGDLRNAIDVYKAYRTLAIQDHAGEQVIINRQDNDVYAAVVKAYASWGMTDEVQKFVSKITSSMQATESGEELTRGFKDAIVFQGLVQERLQAGDSGRALQLTEEYQLSPAIRNKAYAQVCSTAADASQADVVTKASHSISNEDTDAHLSMLALNVRLGNLEAARRVWTELKMRPIVQVSFIEPTAMYAIGLVGKGFLDEAMSEARQAFSHVRSSIRDASAFEEAKGRIDEAIELIGNNVSSSTNNMPASATVQLLRTMTENSGLVTPVAERLLASLGPHNISSLNHHDLALAVESQAEMLKVGVLASDFAHHARFALLVDTLLHQGTPIDAKTRALVDKVFSIASGFNPATVARWHDLKHQASRQNSLPFASPPFSPALSKTESFNPAADPYASMTDLRASNTIDSFFDNHRSSSSSSLDEALLRFKDCRRLGRHPRPSTYAKLIFNAAKDRRSRLIHELLAMFKTDMPFIPGHPASVHAYTVVLDNMLAAALTLSDRNTAAQCHQEILSMGGAPSANTYGLYITNLNSGQAERVFDEATEAVKIFERARKEGVELTSFLFNALIGKLSKARRIDDTLRYFHEMQMLNIRPTSVTYGTVISALCRVSNASLAEMLFNEMEDQPNYRPRAAPYNSVMQFHLTTSLDSKAVLSYYNRMLSHSIAPTSHTFKLLIDTHATLSPTNISAAEHILAHDLPAAGLKPEATHFASLIHAKGCVHSDMPGALSTFESAQRQIPPHPALYQALFESFTANHDIAASGPHLAHMRAHGVKLTPYIANALIKGWSSERASPKGADVEKAKSYYDALGREKREPSTYEAMARGLLGVGRKDEARQVVAECVSRGYPGAVVEKVVGVLGM